jgi:hypothetical protein
MFNKKAAIGLAINTIVIVIISIVILGAGVALMRNMIGGAEDIKDQLDRQTEAELERLLIDQGKKVALPLHTATIEAGENHVFGLGILNIDESYYWNQFIIDVTASSYIDSDGITDPAFGGTDPMLWVLYDPGPVTVNENEHQSEAIQVNPPEDTPKGTFIFNVVVTYTGDPDLAAPNEGQYDNTKKFYVTVT